MTQSSLWQDQQRTSEYAELCNALYEREVGQLAKNDALSDVTLRGRLKSLPYYVQKAAHQMVSTDTPLDLDSQNATWSCKQSKAIPLTGQEPETVWQWFEASGVEVGLIIPVFTGEQILIDSIDRVDENGKRFRSNLHGWFTQDCFEKDSHQLLKPTKKVMMAACAGHRWRDNKVIIPKTPTLRELLLSCAINWRNLHKPLPR